jgi:hypothetical protein
MQMPARQFLFEPKFAASVLHFCQRYGSEFSQSSMIEPYSRAPA